MNLIITNIENFAGVILILDLHHIQGVAGMVTVNGTEVPGIRCLLTDCDLSNEDAMQMILDLNTAGASVTLAS
jgi:hypothetical protein